MSMWWLQPGWADAVCQCGAHIRNSGGDPDWGLCWPCMQRKTQAEEEQRQMHREMERAYYAQMEGDMEYESWSAQ